MDMDKDVWTVLVLGFMKLIQIIAVSYFYFEQKKSQDDDYRPIDLYEVTDMKTQQVGVDFWAMAKSMFTYGALTALCWVMLRLFSAVFTLPRRMRQQQQTIQQSLQELQRRFPDLNITEEDLINAEKELDDLVKEHDEKTEQGKKETEEKAIEDKEKPAEETQTNKIEDKKTI
ncbi:uncharacterized protein LOC133520761 [Cydia pomonella]|uniref:uncharacterized protein LOC133520761 n=1 Tax=Cydia pomonella TaxID=82600 RepID=UPI002ADE2B58|nr:uncharacterized protein LOC133520761 [Cydia pomonella]